MDRRDSLLLEQISGARGHAECTPSDTNHPNPGYRWAWKASAHLLR